MDMKVGLAGVVGVVVLVILELILFPIALGFLTNLNNSAFVSASDKNYLAYVPTLMVVMVLFTLIGGTIFVIYLAIKSGK